MTHGTLKSMEIWYLRPKKIPKNAFWSKLVTIPLGDTMSYVGMQRCTSCQRWSFLKKGTGQLCPWWVGGGVLPPFSAEKAFPIITNPLWHCPDEWLSPWLLDRLEANAGADLSDKRRQPAAHCHIFIKPLQPWWPSWTSRTAPCRASASPRPSLGCSARTGWRRARSLKSSCRLLGCLLSCCYLMGWVRFSSYIFISLGILNQKWPNL